MSYKILRRAEQEIFRLPEVKNFLRISHDYDDMWVVELINSSIEAAENFLRIKLLQTVIEVQFDYISNSRIVLPITPVIEITRLFINIRADEEVRIERYKLQDSTINIPHLPDFKLIVVEYIAGYIDQKAIPAAIRQGILLHTAEMYDSHGANSYISDEVRRLYQPFRKMSI